MTLLPAGAPVRREDVNILLVDDDPGILETLVDIFEDMGFQAETAMTGAQALAKMQARPFNLALLDIRLPDMQGTELLAHARRLQPDIKCVMATGNASLPSAVESLNEGAYAYLQKPIEVPHVKTTVRRALEQQQLERLTQRLLSQLQALGDITDAALATLELDELLARILEKSVFYHHADGGVIYLLDAAAENLLPRMTHGQVPDGGPLSLGEGLAGYSVQRGEIVTASGDDLRVDPIPQREIGASVAAPLRSRNRLIGAIRLDRHSERPFAGEELELLRLFAERAGVLVDNARLYDQERHLARTLAESFLSKTPARDDIEVASYYQPAAEVALIGGDYFDFLEIDEHRMGVVIGDVCGKGLAAAIYTAKAKDMLYAYARENPSPQWVITRLNHALHSQMSEECMFITMIYGILDSRTGTFTYTNAAHPPPILYHPRSGELIELKTTGGMVGALEDMEFTQNSVQLEPGSVLAMFTDGVTEARTDNTMLESEGVQEVVRAHASGSAEEIASAIFNRALQFASGVLKDDVAIVVIRNG
jgi:phosphoserine phosphatase RsbU/P